MHIKGVLEIRNHTKKHIRKKLEVEFGGSLQIFLGDKDNLIVNMIALEYMMLNDELEELSKSIGDASGI